MKNYFIAFIALLCVCIASCKKDDLGLTVEKVYVDANYNANLIYFERPVFLSLKPKYAATVGTSSGIDYDGTYKKLNDKIIVKLKGSTYEYQTVSETELIELHSGVVLKLKVN